MPISGTTITKTYGRCTRAYALCSLAGHADLRLVIFAFGVLLPREFCIFLTTGIVVSAFALPIVLARAGGVIQWGACMLVLTGNVVMFLTIFGFFVAFGNDDGFDYSSWGAY